MSEPRQEPEHEATRAEQPQESEPDPRFTLANERTFLAWNRTALALVAAGLAVTQLLPPFEGISWGRQALGLPLIIFGALTAIASYLEWVRDQRALRRKEPLPRSVLPLALSIAIAAVCVIAAVLVLIQAKTG